MEFKKWFNECIVINENTEILTNTYNKLLNIINGAKTYAEAITDLRNIKAIEDENPDLFYYMGIGYKIANDIRSYLHNRNSKDSNEPTPYSNEELLMSVKLANEVVSKDSGPTDKGFDDHQQKLLNYVKIQDRKKIASDLKETWIKLNTKMDEIKNDTKDKNLKIIIDEVIKNQYFKFIKVVADRLSESPQLPVKIKKKETI